MTEKPDDRHPVDVLAEQFIQKIQTGIDTSIDEFVNEYPEFESEIRAVFPAVLAIEKAKPPPIADMLLHASQLEVVGGFKVLREVGRGGMGVVFEAEEIALGRSVALKILPRAALLSKRRLDRFKREAGTAANLHHTNIVPVYSVGEDQGLHFYAMQLIDGVGLDVVVREFSQHGRSTWVDSGPGTPEWFRLVAEMGMQVSGALEYAHSRGTLHRDIKPANLLVDRESNIWITDFGIAKAVGQSTLTGSGDMVGTLQYMPPEQSEGIYDARGDVYSLGLTLYELLTQTRPFVGDSPAALLKEMDRGAVSPPSRVTPGIPRDLETIVLKAMSRTPLHRYETAWALEDDLRRFIDGRPIAARPVSAVGQVWRWCKRNRMVASFAALAFVSVCVAALMGWTGLLQTRELLHQTEAERVRAESNLGLSLQAFDDIFDSIAGESLGDRLNAEFDDPDRAPAHSSPVSAQNAVMLERLVDFYDRFAQANRNNPMLQRATARAHRRVGDINRALGRLKLAQVSYGKAIDVLDQLPEAETLIDRCGIRNAQGRILALLGQVEEAVEAHHAALAILEDGTIAADDVRALYERIRCNECLGVLTSGPDRTRGGARLRRRGERGSNSNVAARHFDRAIELSEILTRIKPNEPESHLMLATGLRGLALVTRYTPRHEESVQCLVRATDILRMLMEKEPDVATFKYELAELITSMEIRALLPDEIADSLAQFEMALSFLLELNKQHPEMPRYATSLARTHGLIGDIKRQGNDDTGALTSYRESLRVYNEMFIERPSIVVGRWQFARVQQELVFLLVDTGRLEEAVQALRESIKGAEAAARAGVGDRRSRRFLERQQEMLRRFQGMLENP